MLKRLLSLYTLAILLGLLVGLIGGVFQLTIDQVTRGMQWCYQYFKTYGIPVLFTATILSMLMVWLAWFLVQRFAPEASGSGIQEIKARLLHRIKLYWHHLKLGNGYTFLLLVPLLVLFVFYIHQL